MHLQNLVREQPKNQVPGIEVLLDKSCPIAKELLFDQKPGERIVTRLRHLPLERNDQYLPSQIIILKPLGKGPI
jgi:hypothetical protein